MLLIHIENASLQRGYCPACTSGLSNNTHKKKTWETTADSYTGRLLAARLVLAR